MSPVDLSGKAPKSPKSPKGPKGPKGSLWRTFKAVAWGFFGVRKNSSYQEDIARLTPLHIVVVGLVAVVLFVSALILLVKYVVAA